MRDQNDPNMSLPAKVHNSASSLPHRLTSRCLTMLTTSRVEYGYETRPRSAMLLSSPNARTSLCIVCSFTRGPYCLRSWISLEVLGLSTECVLNRSPRAPKKSLPRNGKPGLFARTIILKSGCIVMQFASRASPAARETIRLPSDRIISPDSTSV